MVTYNETRNNCTLKYCSPYTGPGGQPYYYHAASQQSTYVRPLPVFPVVPPPAAQPPKKKKEKPLVKKPIPGTEWLRVMTTEGNTFYTHRGRKESVWVAPEEIKEALLELERAEALEVEQARLEQQEKEKEAMKAEREREEGEVDRIKAEVQGLVKRRKRGELEPLDEVVITKKARVEEDSEEEVEVEENQHEDEDEEDEESENESEGDWQKEAAVQLATEAEEDERRRDEEAKRVKEAEEAEVKRAQEKQPLSMPDRVDLSLDEAKALFKVFGLRLSIILTLTAIADAVAREGHQPLAPLGYLFTTFYLRPSICAPPLCLSTS